MARTAAARAARQTVEARLEARIRKVHQDSDGTYGAPRITAELRDEEGIRPGWLRPPAADGATTASRLPSLGSDGVHPRGPWPVARGPWPVARGPWPAARARAAGHGRRTGVTGPARALLAVGPVQWTIAVRPRRPTA
ncbi:transposase [Streptomyces sp. NPDC051555]|uniref:transposase n=1 Tax=Streptomyces sp. NPDC051555 TaxID=3365657 RepID=UPI0037A272F3